MTTVPNTGGDTDLNFPLPLVCQQKSSPKAGRAGGLAAGVEQILFIHLSEAAPHPALTGTSFILVPSTNLGLGSTVLQPLKYSFESFQGPHHTMS